MDRLNLEASVGRPDKGGIADLTCWYRRARMMWFSPVQMFVATRTRRRDGPWSSLNYAMLRSRAFSARTAPVTTRKIFCFGYF